MLQAVGTAMAALAAPAGVKGRGARLVVHVLRQRPGRPAVSARINVSEHARPSRRAISCVDTDADFSRITSRASRIPMRSAGIDPPGGLPKGRPDQANGGARQSTKDPGRDHSVMGGRDHLVMPGDIIPLQGATSSRFGGRLRQESALAEGWTPEQISGWLKSGNEPRLRAIGCETIYAFIYRTAQKAEALWRYLTRRHKRRRPRRARPSRDTIKDRASIHDRPKTIESRGEAGHWEGDLIICKCTRPVLVLHERKSRVTLAARLTGKTAAETISAMLAVFGRIDPHLRRSITFDNDTAFAQHGLLRTMRDMTTWFCDAYASWQKGGVENANGRLRRWLPRHLDIDRTSDQDIQEIVLTTNLTPRKCLGFKTPCLDGAPWSRVALKVL